MGWRPHSVPQSEGKQICQGHWEQHKGPDNFTLFKAFGFPEPVLAIRTEPVKAVKLCDCGAELLPRRRYCPECAADQAKEHRRRWRQKQQGKQPEPTAQEHKDPTCKRCGGPRESGHTYCEQCAKSSKRESKRAWAKTARSKD